MPNPWLKKNPFMSMWLSSANRILGSVRGHTTAQATRQVNAAMTEATKATVKAWSGVLKPTSAGARTKRKRKR